VFPDRKTAAFTNPASPESRLVSTALVHAWEERFAEHVRTGNGTSGPRIYLFQPYIRGQSQATSKCWRT
jgi:hypothetical protein